MLDRAFLDQMHFIVIPAHDIAGNIIGDDPVDALALALLAGIADDIVGFRSKADQQFGAVRAGGDAGQNIGIFSKDQRRRRGAAFLDLVPDIITRAPVGDGGDHDRDIARQGGFHRIGHVLRAADIDAVDAQRRAQIDRAGHQRDPCSGSSSRSGDGIALLAGRTVGEIAHRINRLMRRPGGDKHMFAVKRAVLDIAFKARLACQRIECIIDRSQPAFRRGIDRIGRSTRPAGHRHNRRGCVLAFERLRRALPGIDLVIDRLAVGRRGGAGLALLGDEMFDAGIIGFGQFRAGNNAFGQFHIGELIVILFHPLGRRAGNDRSEQTAQTAAARGCVLFLLVPFVIAVAAREIGGNIGTGRTRIEAKRIGDFEPDGFRLRQAAGAEFAAGHVAHIGLHHMHAAGAQRLDIARGRLVLPHFHIHGGHGHDRLIGGEQHGCGQIVGNARSHFRQHIGRGRAHDDQIGIARQLDMTDFSLVLEIPQSGVHLIAGQRCKRHRRDELRPALGQHAGHIGPAAPDQAHQLA